MPSPTAVIRVMLPKNEGGTLGSGVAGYPAFLSRRSMANLLASHLILATAFARPASYSSCEATRIASRDWISKQSALLL
jgi:hypothetical protein